MYRDAGPHLQRLLAGYLDGGQGLLDFQRSFIERYARLPDGSLHGSDAAFWREVFALVTHAAPEPGEGVLGDLELKAQLGGMWRARRDEGVESLNR